MIMEENIKRKWWKEIVVYQLYPRSFNDTNGDGIGDLKGIIEKLDYIKSLGIDVVWLNPIYESPNDDMGYDISDYKSIMKEFGTMEDFDALLKGLHKRGIKLIMDLVVNHTSDEHPWFKESRKSKDNPYRNYYHWWDAEKGNPPYRWSIFDKESNAWKYDETTHSYYLHIFSEKQPDLNWENPAVRNEVYDLMKFWLNKGIDGFRLDVIACISKDITFPEMPVNMAIGEWFPYYTKGPNLHEYLQEMYHEVLSKYDCMNVGEMSFVTTENALLFVDEERNELQTFYHFDHTNVGVDKNNFMYSDDNNWDLVEWKHIFYKWDKVFAEKGWGTIYLGNHDMSRMVSRYGNDSDKYRTLSAKMLQTFILSMRATPYIYNGDEIGMVNTNHTNIENYQDVYTINYYNQLKQKGEDHEGFLKSHAKISRDNARTPMQWNDNSHAGFTTSKPWLAVNENFKTINVEEQEIDPDSVLNYCRKMIELRKNHLLLIYGAFELVDANNKQLFAYTRSLNNEQILVVLNFSDTPAPLNSSIEKENKTILISNYEQPSINNLYQPYAAVIYKMGI
jgi:oligo-1,6-glucosidase